MNVPPDEQNMTGEGQQPTPPEGEEAVPGQPGIESAGERVESPATDTPPEGDEPPPTGEGGPADE